MGLEKIGMPEVSELTEKILKKNEFRVVSEVSQMPEELDIDLKMYKPLCNGGESCLITLQIASNLTSLLIRVLWWRESGWT